jgi:hypothetical protein
MYPQEKKNDIELYENIMEVSNYVFFGNHIDFLHQARHSPCTQMKTRDVSHRGRAMHIKKVS